MFKCLAEGSAVLDYEFLVQIFLHRVNLLKVECLAVRNGALAMAGVPTVHSEILMFVHGFSI